MSFEYKNFSDVITFTRASTGGVFDKNGLYTTVAANLPRFDYDPVTLQPKGILIEESRTNLVKDSAFSKTVAGWFRSPGIVDGELGVAPDGTTTAALISSTPGVNSFLSQVSTITVGTTNTFSLYCKPNGSSPMSLFFEFGSGTGGTVQFNVVSRTFSGGSPTSTSYTEVGNGWVRLSITVPSAKLAFYIAAYGPAGDTVHSGYIWGFQAEAGTFASSLIPTTTTQATRAADLAIVTISSWYNKDSFSVYSEFDTGGYGAGNTNAAFWFRDTTNAAYDLLTTRRADAGQITTVYADSTGTVRGRVTSVQAYAAGQIVKAAFALELGYLAESVNGQALVQDSAANVTNLPSPDYLVLGSTGNNQQFLNGHLRVLKYYPLKLSPEALRAITS